ncbi:MAG: BlaI/MecI/CopY family transcriptional regulator [Clostridia bacterium]|nr:BlaI/MecI/CopY family transcriptional regulator [Clostridia bacterium]
MKLFDSERKVMEILWREGSISAVEIARLLSVSAGWNRNTTYTVIKKCIDKNYIKREDPGYICSALIAQKTVQREELAELLDKSFDGSVTKLFAALLNVKQISQFDVKKMKKALKNL